MFRIINILIAVSLISSCSNKKEKALPKVMPLTEAVYASGNLKAFNQYKVYAKSSGILKYRFVNENDTISAGQVIARIEEDASKIQLDNARILLEDARRNAGPESPVLSQLKIEVESTRIKMEDDSINMIRFMNLYKQNVGTKADLEKKEILFKTSKNNLEEAEKRYTDRKHQLELQCSTALNTVRLNSVTKDDRSIKSMIDGKIYSFYKEEGEMVQIQEPVALIGDKKRFLIELNVDELDINKVKIGQEAVVTMDTYEEKVFKAKVTKIYPVLDTRTQTFNVEAEFVDVPERLYPGLTVEANIIIRDKPSALVIPKAFLLPGDSVLLDNSKKRKVSTGLKNLEYVEILSGLNKSEAIYR